MVRVTEFNSEPKIAYFSMEIGLQPDIPTYSGGLGVLAGDTIRSAADLQLPVVAVTLIHRRGYFTQELNDDGWQIEHPVDWNPEDFMEMLPARVTVPIEGREVSVRAWQFNVNSPTSGTIPILYLDTSGEENADEDRGITDTLYGGDSRYRLKQEIVLGLGGYRMLNELGVHVKKYQHERRPRQPAHRRSAAALQAGH